MDTTTADLQVLNLQQQTDQIETAHRINKHIATELSYNDFYWNYMNANCPVVLTGVSSEWDCRHNWTIPKSTVRTENENRLKESNTVVNFDYLKEKLCDCRVPVTDCSTQSPLSCVKYEMTFHDFVDYWKAKCVSETKKTAEEDTNRNADVVPTKLLYLKDWHLKAKMPDYDFYHVPKQFASDWLNEHLVSNGRDDYRFVYMGPKDTWTPFHADVFGSFSWSTNIMGCKKWIFLPPGEELKLADSLGNLPYTINEVLLNDNGVRFYTLLQGENEAVFVPTGWYHQVYNCSDTISINHNWFNACNVHHIWRNLFMNMGKVKGEIADCRQMDNFEEHCQLMLRANFGINYLDFLELVEFIVDRRLNATKLTNGTGTSSKIILFDTFTPNDFHIRHDLHSIHSVIELMLLDETVCNSRQELYRRCLCLKELTKGF